MSIKDATITNPEARKRKGNPFLSSCFRGSPVFDPDISELPVAAVGERKGKGKSSWFSWSRFRRKKKIVAVDAATDTSSAAKDSASKCPFKKPSKARNSRSPSETQQLNTADSQPQADVSEQQFPSSTIPTNSNTRAEPPQPSSNPDPIQIRNSTNQSSSPRRITRHVNHHIVRTGRVEPVVGLWIMATTLGVLVFFGRASAVAFLSSCLYILPHVRATSAAENSGRRMNLKGVDLNSEHKKRVIMEGLLERKGQRPSRGF
ncbi:uncharacterized protein [Typha angustifolia]|uniref:uncharacterized protein isoform X2 n=1 Tax=Typha angustifolia TaxID=59011 RepID=UPI003C2BC412